jgi:ribosome recycling factor
VSDFILNTKTKMEKTVEVYKKDLAQIRTGRANPAMVEDIKVEYYGAMTPMNQMGTISIPEPRLIMIKPYDTTSIKSIEKAIQSSGLGLTPSNDGVVIRIPLPELTGERRKELSKIVRQKSEEKKVAIRNIRRDIMDDLKKEMAEASQDEMKGISEQIQKVTDGFILKISEITDQKEKEIQTV